MISWLLRQAEVSPAFTFTESVLHEAGDFERARQERLVTRVAIESLPCELVLDGRTVVAVEGPDGGLRAYESAPPHDTVSISDGDLVRWRLNLATIGTQFGTFNNLVGKYAELHPRLHFLGSSESGAGAVLALLDSPERARVLLPSLRALLPSRHERIVAFCPTYEPDPLLSKTLEASNLFVQQLAADNPLRLDFESATPTTFGFKKRGKGWVVRFESSEVDLPDGLGMEYIWRLLRQPDVAVSALALHGGTSDESTAPRDALLDSAAMRSARARASDLQQELEEAQLIGNPERAETIRDEMEKLADRLQSDVGLGGKSRRFSDEAERARVNVTKAIDRALESIKREHAEAGSFLSANISTGIHCIYRSVPGISWRI